MELLLWLENINAEPDKYRTKDLEYVLTITNQSRVQAVPPQGEQI